MCKHLGMRIVLRHDLVFQICPQNSTFQCQCFQKKISRHLINMETSNFLTLYLIWLKSHINYQINFWYGNVHQRGLLCMLDR
jgi:hypothetical protein